MNNLSTLLDRDYLLDIQELRQEFAGIDPSDPESLRGWFVGHHYLGANDHAQVAQVSLRTIRRWQDALGLPRARRRRPPGWRRPRLVLVAPPDWSAGTWLEEQYPAYGIRQIALAIGRSYGATRRLLRRRGVVFLSARAAARSRHPCCTRYWLMEHYVVAGLSLARCARLAGVSTATLTAWLIRFQVRVRSNGEQQRVYHAAALREADGYSPVPARRSAGQDLRQGPPRQPTPAAGSA
jgi:hypothetical protein